MAAGLTPRQRRYRLKQAEKWILKLEKEYGDQFTMSPRMTNMSNGETVLLLDAVDNRKGMGNAKTTLSQWSLSDYLMGFNRVAI